MKGPHTVHSGKTTPGNVNALDSALESQKSSRGEGAGSVCTFPGILDPYFSDSHVPEPLQPFLLKKNWRERNFQMLLHFWYAGFPQVVTKLSRLCPAECWKRPLVVSYGHCRLLC